MFIVERSGWGQWVDDGGRSQGNRDAAKRFADRGAADELAAGLNAEMGAGCEDYVAVELAD